MSTESSTTGATALLAVTGTAVAPTPAKTNSTSKPSTATKTVDTVPVKKAATTKPTAKAETPAASQAADFLSVGTGTSKKPPNEIVAADVELPPTLEYAQDIRGTANGSCFTLSIYGDGCLECGSLIPILLDQDDKDSEPKCHFRHGNPHCPAAYHRIQIVGTRLRLLAGVQRAQASDDPNRVLKAFSKLDELSIEDKNFVFRSLGILQDPAAIKQPV